MAVLALHAGAKAFGGRTLFSDLTLELQPARRIGLIGPNGSGKTTLLRILAGLEEADAGTVASATGARIGYLRQDATFDAELTVLGTALAAFAPLWALEEEMRALAAEMARPGATVSTAPSATPSEDAATRRRALRTEAAPTPAPAEGQRPPADPLARYGELQSRFEAAGGYTAEARARQTLAGLGFAPTRLDHPCGVLSGGERVRLSLARLLLESPDALLLDEPTNHLDLPAIRWLEEHLHRGAAAAVIVSHDRHFLDAVTTQTLEMGPQPRLYPGNYSKYLALHGGGEAQGMEAYRRAQAELPRLRAFIATLRAGYTPVPKNRLRRLAELEAVPVPHVAERTIRVRAAAPPRAADVPPGAPTGAAGSVALELAGVQKAYAGRNLFGTGGFTATVSRSDRIGLIGGNGSGKSTLLRILLGQVEPDAGAYGWSGGGRVGWLPQSLEALDPDLTLVQQLTALPGIGTRQAREVLARFLFEGDRVFARTGDCSGGERCRVALARLLLQSWDALLLDEPTNHLDMESRRALEDGLADYPGTILVASHDRFFLDRVAWRLWVFGEPDGVADFDGNYSEWAAPAGGRQDEASAAALAAAIRSAEARVSALRARLSRPDTFADGRGRRLSQQWKAAQAELAELQRRWREATRG